MREQALALERARREEDADAVAAYERALALQKKEIHEQAEEMERAKAFYEQADGSDGLERERLAGRIDRISAELEKIRRALAAGAR
jgi:hypothetical protein